MFKSVQKGGGNVLKLPNLRVSTLWIVLFWNLHIQSIFTTNVLHDKIFFIPSFSFHWETKFNPLSANSTKRSNTLKQFVSFWRRIVWVCLTICGVDSWRVNCSAIDYFQFLTNPRIYELFLIFWWNFSYLVHLKS